MMAVVFVTQEGRDKVERERENCDQTTQKNKTIGSASEPQIPT